MMTDVSERVDRTRIVFYSAGVTFALGLWAYVFGASSPAATGRQWDFVSILPMLLSIATLAVLNAFADRSSLLSDSSTDFFAGGGISRPARFFVFTMLVMTFLAPATGMLVGMLRYAAKDWMHMAWGISLGTTCISASSLIVFGMRKLEPSYF